MRAKNNLTCFFPLNIFFSPRRLWRVESEGKKTDTIDRGAASDRASPNADRDRRPGPNELHGMKLKILTSFVVSTVFFFSLSGMVCVSQKTNKLLKDFWIFDADYPAYTEVFTRAKPWRPSPLHILINVVWRPPTLLLSRVLDASSGDADRAGLFASRILLATISAV